MFKSVGNWFVKASNDISKWGKSFLSASASRSLLILAIIICLVAWIFTVKEIIIETLNGSMHKSLKAIICITTLIVLIAGTILVILLVKSLTASITGALS